MSLSKRPGLRKAGSRKSGVLVAAITVTYLTPHSEGPRNLII